MTLNIHSSRGGQHNGTLLELLVDTATRSAKELYRRIMAHKRTEIMFSISERDGHYYVCINAGPLTSEEGAFYLLADLIKHREATLKELQAHGRAFRTKQAEKVHELVLEEITVIGVTARRANPQDAND